MEIVEPNAELWIPENNTKHVAKCARVCYGKDKGNDLHLYYSLIKNKHFSMLRHETHYYIVPYNVRSSIYKSIEDFIIDIEHDAKICGINIVYGQDNFYIVLNGQFAFNNNLFIEDIKDYEVDACHFEQTEIGHSMMRYTFYITTQISTSRELNRVSPNNIAEQSTRYVTEQGIICRPWWLKLENDEYTSNMYDDTIVRNYIHNCEEAFLAYNMLINNEMKREDARGILPLDTATKCVYTYSVDEWKNIINLRYHETTGKAHPNAKIIAGMIREQLCELGYDL